MQQVQPMEAYRPPDSQRDTETSLIKPIETGRGQSVVRLGRAMLFLYPVLAASLPYLFSMAFWLFWGRPPKPYADDPKFLTPLFTYPHRVAFLLIISWPFFVAAELILSAYTPRSNYRERVMSLLIYAGECMLAWFIISSNNQVNEWFFD